MVQATASDVVATAAEGLKDYLIEVAMYVIPMAAVLASIVLGWYWVGKLIDGDTRFR